MTEIIDLFLVFAAYITLHVLFLHVVGPQHFIRNGFLLLIPFLMFPVLSINLKAVLISLWNMYIFALICSRNSVSLRILDEILREPGQALEKSVLLDRFSDHESLASRVALMEKNGFLRANSPQEVELTSKARLLVRGILLARFVFGAPKSEAR